MKKGKEKHKNLKHCFAITVSRRTNSPPLTELTEIETCKLCYSKPLTNLQLTREGSKLRKTILNTNKLFPEISISLLQLNPDNIKANVCISCESSDSALELLKEALFRIKETSNPSYWKDNLKITRGCNI